MIRREDVDRVKKTFSLKTERLILESKLIKELNGVIQKLHEQIDMLLKQIDMLLKQKKYLQSKLREKNGEKGQEEKEN